MMRAGSMGSRVWMVCAVATGFMGVEARAQEIACPAALTTKQAAEAVPAGWRAAVGNEPASLATVTFFSGPPEQQASLVYDSRISRNGLLYATWKFEPKRKETIWLSCGYASTWIVLSRAIAAQVSECTVVYDPKVLVAGMPEIQKISCK